MLLLLPQGTAGTVSVGVSDTANLQASEGLTSDFTIDTLDNLSFAISDVATFQVSLNRAEFALLTLGDVASLSTTGATAKAGTDTASIQITDASALAVNLGVTDTTSLQGASEAGTVDVLQTPIAGTDDVSISIDDSASASIVADVVQVAGDAVSVRLEDAGSVNDILPIAQIRFDLKPDRITFH